MNFVRLPEVLLAANYSDFFNFLKKSKFVFSQTNENIFRLFFKNFLYPRKMIKSIKSLF